nr:MAG TPA: hypothetical protein [Caudoviricetes sp.]
MSQLYTIYVEDNSEGWSMSWRGQYPNRIATGEEIEH